MNVGYLHLNMIRLCSSGSHYLMGGKWHANTGTIHDHVREGLGVSFKGNHMPKDVSGTFVKDGVKFTVLSSYEKKTLTRIKVQCPDCDVTVSTGRAHQHVCKAKNIERKEMKLHE